MPRPAAQLHDAPQHDDPAQDARGAVETVQFPASHSRPLVPPPAEAVSLAAIERRLGELVRTVRLALAVAAAWMIWQLFGDGIAWLVTAGLWTAGAFALIAVGLGLGMYFSPPFRRAVAGGTKRLFRRSRRGSARRR
ncbi:hypothetical protein [Alienimonas californiensis]|uniref:Uncharacterized protein n=1 Tax=Alienimonas californiensis TaxID=2527989 RepID=A0A517PCJ6_9PLAN|nr:hypothetical protein [Alienimonas californiensis]QDT17103.1 hypothetical protein CA12_32150 [Alienimonas californiensis]